MSAVLAPVKRSTHKRLATLSLYLVQAPHRPVELPAQDGIPTFRDAVVAASCASQAKALARGWSVRNQWTWVDDEIEVKRLAVDSNVTKSRVFSAGFNLA